MVQSPGFGTTTTGYDILPISPNDDADLHTYARAIRCKPVSGEAGTLRVTTRNGKVRNTEIDVGEMLLINVKRVHSTGTTATGLEAII